MVLAMHPEEFAARMREISKNGDFEVAHVDADDLMCLVLTQLGYEEGVEVFENMEKWYA